MKKRLSFTALELVLVITIAAILLSISIPAFYNISAGRRVTGALTGIAANISLARATAVSSNSYVALIFNSEKETVDGKEVITDGEAMRLGIIHKRDNDGDISFHLKEWLSGSSWEKIGDGVIIPSTSQTSFDNFYEGSKSTSPYEVNALNDIYLENNSESGSTSHPRAIIFSPRGQIVTTGPETNPIVIRVAEGTEVPGTGKYTLKKTNNEVTYGRLTVNPLTCRAEVDYVNE